jgi:hypothetical protein
VDPRTEQMLAERRQNAEPPPPPLQGRPAAVGWLKAHWLAVTLAATAVAATCSLSYYLLVSEPALRREQAASAAQARHQLEIDVATRATAMEACLAQAQADYNTLWESACKARQAAAGCALPQAVVREQEKRRSDARNDCLKQYSLTTH